MKAFLERDNGEYVCSECGKTSTIYFIKKMNVVIPVVTLVAVTIFILYYFLGNPASLWGTVFEALPFIIFFLSTPFFFRLVPMNTEKKNQSDKKSTSNEIYSTSKSNIKSGIQSEKRRAGYNRVNDRSQRPLNRYDDASNSSNGKYRRTGSGTNSGSRLNSGSRSGTRQSGYSGGRYSDKSNGKRYY